MRSPGHVASLHLWPSFTYRLSAQMYTFILCSVMLSRESTATLPRPLHPRASCWVLPLGEHREGVEWLEEQGVFLCLAHSVSMCPKRSARAGSRFPSYTWTYCILPLRGVRSSHVPHTPCSSESRPFVFLFSIFSKALEVPPSYSSCLSLTSEIFVVVALICITNSYIKFLC